LEFYTPSFSTVSGTEDVQRSVSKKVESLVVYRHQYQLLEVVSNFLKSVEVDLPCKNQQLQIRSYFTSCREE